MRPEKSAPLFSLSFEISSKMKISTYGNYCQWLLERDFIALILSRQCKLYFLCLGKKLIGQGYIIMTKVVNLI